ncbi:integral membrane sensor signal transduction [Marinobacter santoriniensis NKSG1]|uniref:histidine kinase n=1 Tax=Marinobacter santoriniensis NKSG1 TaxID=1288826 RepID=M7CTA3_9GAMM|nr:integral membrane sensor signal transduction [Marinobacter santoriniensis NKSG1]
MQESFQRPVSLQRRLGVGLTILLASLWLAATGIAGFVVRSEMYEVFDSALQETAERLMPLAVMEILNQDTSNGSINPQNIAPLQEAKEYLTYTVRDASGNVLLQSHEAKGDIFPASPETGFHSTDHYRFYGTSAISNTLFIEVAEPLEHRRKALLETVLALLVPLALAIPLSFLGVWYYVRQSLRPMVAYRDAIEARGEGDLTPVDSQGRLPAEMEPVSRAVNSLMERLERALEAERSFTANSAHELRTPIAEALAQTQRLKREIADVLPSDERIKRIESSLRKLSRLSEKLMQLARAEGAGLLLPEAADLTPVLHYVLQDFRGSSDRLDVDVPEDGPVLSRLDPDVFAILARNLIENALKYGGEDESVGVQLSPGVFRVTNSGPPVEEQTLRGLSERFVRGRGTAKVHGSGLGLAIVSAIAQGVHTSLDIRSPATGRSDGFEVAFSLPGA